MAVGFLKPRSSQNNLIRIVPCQMEIKNLSGSATLGGGCFWCLEAIFQRVRGVEEVVPGYAGGDLENPTYELVCGGGSGHAEVVQIKFDGLPASFKDLLHIFWRVHDPATLNRQGADIGSQYRSVIFFHDEEQKAIALDSAKEVEESGLWADPIVTEISPLTKFYPAEKYHRNYHRQNPDVPYCRMVIDPKLQKFMNRFKGRVKRPFLVNA